MHEFSFSDTICPDRTSVLELPLLPFSIGHRLLLLKQRNPLLWAEESDFNTLPFHDQIRHLIEACYTCGQTYEFRMRLEHGEATWWERWHNKRAVRAWHKRRRKAEKGGGWRVAGDETGPRADEIPSRNTQHATRNDSTDIATDYYSVEVAKFRNHLAAGRIATDFDYQRAGTPFFPTQSVAEATGRSLGGPYDAVLIQFLVASALVRDEAAALEYPFARAQAHFITHQESEGCLKILNADEMQFKEDCHARNLEEAQAAGYRDVKTYIAAMIDKARAAKAAVHPTPQKSEIVNRKS